MSGNPYAAKRAGEPAVVEAVVEVPAGTIDEVVSWVGGDVERAELALRDEESKGDHARKTLVARLKDVLNG